MYYQVIKELRRIYEETHPANEKGLRPTSYSDFLLKDCDSDLLKLHNMLLRKLPTVFSSQGVAWLVDIDFSKPLVADEEVLIYQCMYSPVSHGTPTTTSLYYGYWSIVDMIT